VVVVVFPLPPSADALEMDHPVGKSVGANASSVPLTHDGDDELIAQGSHVPAPPLTTLTNSKPLLHSHRRLTPSAPTHDALAPHDKPLNSDWLHTACNTVPKASHGNRLVAFLS
jgi:hypothetical protein